MKSPKKNGILRKKADGVVEMNSKYEINTKENREFLKASCEDLLNFGHRFPSPNGGSYYLGDDGTPWKDRNRETWITCRMVHVYSLGLMLGHEGSGELVDAALKGLKGELHDDKNGGWYAGVTPEEIREALPLFKGVSRRFDVHAKSDRLIYIDDYAHHPREIEASLSSIREMWPDKRLTVAFQPHLYSRTNDFYPEFAKSLNLADQVILLDIYPAREEPIPGVTSEIIFDAVTIPAKKLIRKSELLDLVEKEADTFEVVLMVGAGDIDRLIEPVKQILDKKL